METYENLIMEVLAGETPREKYQHLVSLFTKEFEAFKTGMEIVMNNPHIGQDKIRHHFDEYKRITDRNPNAK